MKKLFTLFALLVCFLSAKAVVVVDAEVNFSSYADGPSTLTAWGGGDRLSFQGGYLHYHGEEATPNPWDVQFFPIQGVSADEGVTYTVEFKIKGSVAGPLFNMKFGGVDKYGFYNLAGNDQWEIVKVEYVPTSTDGSVLFQCGSYVGDWDMEYMKISHEERDQKPVEWANIIENSTADGEYGEVACVQTKVWDVDVEKRAVISPALIENLDGNNAFVCHALAVNPPLLWDEDGEQWGTQHSAGDPMPDNAWQNQMWITFPRPMKAGEQVKVSFKYKASKAVKVDTQSHGAPTAYIGGGAIGQLSFTTTWQTVEKTFSADDGQQSIAFNLGSEIYDEDIDFYLDDVQVSLMVLEEGFFVAAINTTDELAEYDYENAIKCEYNDDEAAYVAVVGTVGDSDSWVNEVMISTVRGNDKAFLAACIKPGDNKKVVDDPDAWLTYVDGSKAKIKLPALGVWTIMIDPELTQFNFTKIEGEEEKEPIVIVANPTHVIVNAKERDTTEKEFDETLEGEGQGQPWDNQFMIMANRNLQAGEVTVISFKYKAAAEAKASTQCGGTEPGAYIHWAAIGDVNFTAEEQVFESTYTVPSECGNNMASLTFNLAEIKEANVYEIYDIVWKTEDETETLIDMEGTKNFFVKEGANTIPYEFGTENPNDLPTGINTVNTVAVKTTKSLENGSIVIKSARGTYTVAGAQLK